MPPLAIRGQLLLHLVRRLSTVSNGLPWAQLTSVYASQMAGRLRFLGADSALREK